MNILNDIYNKTIIENDRNLRFWQDYLRSLKSLDFNTYSDKLKVPILVPIGNRILFRGELKHTNEITVSLGADYFVKCSLKQADILREHRIKAAQEKVTSYMKEKEYLDNKFSFSKNNIYDGHGKEIVEVYSEKEDKAWRQIHRENVRRSKKNEMRAQNNVTEEITDEELWERLEELELQEELENEYLDTRSESDNAQKVLPFVSKNKKQEIENKDAVEESSGATEIQGPSKYELLVQALNKQNELENKLLELKNRERDVSKTKNDLISRLDEMDQLDELEDEMDRLNEILESEDADDVDIENEEKPKSSVIQLKRSVSFADEDDSETINIILKHSSNQPNVEPYDPTKGITKPSDIYAAHSNLFVQNTSILKKTKYGSHLNAEIINNKIAEDIKVEQQVKNYNIGGDMVKKTIVVKDVIEKGDATNSNSQIDKRPISLFKKRRMQNKS